MTGQEKVNLLIQVTV